MRNAQDTRCAAATGDPDPRRFHAPARSLLGEFTALWNLVRDRVSRGARPWLAAALAAATVVVWILLHAHVLRPELWRSGDVYASLPLLRELSRLPMSFFLPTPYLPLWAACAQLLVVIGLGEVLLGRWFTLVVVIVGHVGATLLARVVLDSVHGHVFGLTPSLVHVLDTGPSAATTAVGACVLVAAHMNRSALLLGAGLLAAALFIPGVDGVEHLAALVWGVLAGLALSVVTAPSGPPRVAAEKGRDVRAFGLLRRLREPRSTSSRARDA